MKNNTHENVDVQTYLNELKHSYLSTISYCWHSWSYDQIKAIGSSRSGIPGNWGSVSSRSGIPGNFKSFWFVKKLLCKILTKYRKKFVSFASVTWQSVSQKPTSALPICIHYKDSDCHCTVVIPYLNIVFLMLDFYRASALIIAILSICLSVCHIPVFD